MERSIKMSEHETRLRIQEYDCTYGEINPNLIHCSIKNPCMKHKYEKTLDIVVNALKEFGTCDNYNYMTGRTCLEGFKYCIFCEALVAAKRIK